MLSCVLHFCTTRNAFHFHSKHPHNSASDTGSMSYSVGLPGQPSIHSRCALQSTIFLALISSVLAVRRCITQPTIEYHPPSGVSRGLFGSRYQTLSALFPCSSYRSDWSVVCTGSSLICRPMRSRQQYPTYMLQQSKATGLRWCYGVRRSRRWRPYFVTLTLCYRSDEGTVHHVQNNPGKKKTGYQ